MTQPISEAISLVQQPETGEIQLVVFNLAGCEAAVGIRQVREIIRIAEITRMPKAPLFLEGVLNLRGKIVPVLDLKKRFQMPLLDRTEESRILIVEMNDQILGFSVDKVVEVLKVSPEMIVKAPEAILHIGAEFLGGTVSLGRRLILLFNLQNLLSMDEGKVLPETKKTAIQEEKNRGH